MTSYLQRQLLLSKTLTVSNKAFFLRSSKNMRHRSGSEAPGASAREQNRGCSHMGEASPDSISTGYSRIKARYFTHVHDIWLGFDESRLLDRHLQDGRTGRNSQERTCAKLNE